MDISDRFLIALLVISFLTSVFSIWYLLKPPSIAAIIEGFDFDDSQKMSLLASVSEKGTEAIPFIKPFLESHSDAERLAAVISLVSILDNDPFSRESIVLILKGLGNDENYNVRMFAGKGLISQGEVEGVDILISCLISADVIVTDPNQRVKERARLYLIEYTDYDGINYEKWQNWWQNNRHLVEWDENSNEFKLHIPRSWPF